MRNQELGTSYTLSELLAAAPWTYSALLSRWDHDSAKLLRRNNRLAVEPAAAQPYDALELARVARDMRSRYVGDFIAQASVTCAKRIRRLFSRTAQAEAAEGMTGE